MSIIFMLALGYDKENKNLGFHTADYYTVPVPIKCMIKKLGLIPDNTHRLPMVAADEALQKRLDAVLQRSGLLSE